jgi:hypothetical protein
VEKERERARERERERERGETEKERATLHFRANISFKGGKGFSRAPFKIPVKSHHHLTAVRNTNNEHCTHYYPVGYFYCRQIYISKGGK